ncbi:hypothetical protein HIM_12535 [Hirsutella minnesotensis 3608]|uniref:Zn(2)-C6 fungal-type domain-containing protein n=1 Tax=Hirsutella minnesotensis 3608 TaxID=1043627 RepID=A0A0F7ZVZ3_9HYPO|nr:hypothetical protein HIM_12535 [Hirsutella minnesotensis 3608]
MESSQKRKLIPIAPAPEGQSAGQQPHAERDPPSAPIMKMKRTMTLVACEGCRRRRVKCDGKRPLCGQCARKGEDCQYEAGEGETVLLALKKRYGALEKEHTRYKELFNLLRSRPDRDANEILRRLRTAEEPLVVLEAINHAELLLQGPSFEEEVCNERLLRLDQQALENSVIKVPARPWTEVAGHGLVSELITDYFTWDNTYLLPSIDRNVFIGEMTQCEISSARWCSPLLVNAMCARRSQILERARLFGALKKQDVTLLFLDEAKKHLDVEQGRATIPTVQGLMLMYMTTTCLGKDRAGRIYRNHALELIPRLRIEAQYHSLLEDGHEDPKERNLLSKAIWGLFIFESRVAFLYFQPSSIPVPQVPNPFAVDVEKDSWHQTRSNVDVLDRPFEESPCEVPLVPDINAATCSLAVLFYDIMMHNTNEETVWGSKDDLRKQRGLYSKFKKLTASWPKRFHLENNFAPSTCYLRMQENEVGFSIIQTLRNGTLFETPASEPGTTISDLCLVHCASDSQTINAYLNKWPFDTLLWRSLYLSMQPLVLTLDN